MIRNILFDMGNVLIRFDPHLFICEAGCEADETLLMHELFRSVDWVASDRGIIDEETLVKRACERIPARLHDQVRTLVMSWYKNHHVIDGSEELVKELAANGYELYLLTNAACRQPLYWPEYPVSAYFPKERVYLSADYLCIKPEIEFFEGALRRFQLNKEECIFIDDSPVNCEAAVRCGIEAIVFHGDMEELRRKLAQAGVHVTPSL